jgi:hypothetical protein
VTVRSSGRAAAPVSAGAQGGRTSAGGADHGFRVVGVSQDDAGAAASGAEVADAPFNGAVTGGAAAAAAPNAAP